jgi:large subunit ribosomal protein L1
VLGESERQMLATSITRVTSSLPSLSCRFKSHQVRCSSSAWKLWGTAKNKEKYSLENAIDILREKAALFEHENASFSVNINLNLDPRIKGQKMRGVVDLPHGSGKSYACVALTLDPELTEAALSAGAIYAGDIEPRILSNEIQWPKFQRLIATNDLEQNVVSKGEKLARKLKKHKITPCVEDKTLVAPEDFVDVVRKHANGGFIMYQTDTHGNVATTIGKANFENCKLVENFNHLLRHLFDTQSVVFGTGPRAKKKNVGKYVLGIHLTASKTSALPLDLTTIDLLCERNQQDIPVDKKWRSRQ